MRTGLDYFLEGVRKLTRAKPPFNAAFTTQVVYTLNQSVTIIEGLQQIHRKQEEEIEKLKMKLQGIKPKKAVTDPIRNAKMVADLEAGMTIRAIGKKYGITPARAAQILRRLGATNARSTRVKRLSGASNTERAGEAEGGEEARRSPDAHGIGQDGDGGGGDRFGAWQG